MWTMKLSNSTYVFRGYLSLCHKKSVKSFHNNIYYKRPHISRYLRNDAALSEQETQEQGVSCLAQLYRERKSHVDTGTTRLLVGELVPPT